MTGAIDWRLFTKNGMWGIDGQSIFSRVDNEKVGFATDLTIRKESGRHMRGAVGTVLKDPHFHINKLGYTSRNDYQEFWTWWQYQTQDDWWIVRNSWNNINYGSAWNYDGYNISHWGNFNNWIEFTNGWEAGGGVGFQAEKYSDLETRGNGIWEWPNNPTYSWWASIETDDRKLFSFTLNPGSGGDRGGSWFANYIGVEFRPKSNMEFEIGTNYRRDFNTTRWLLNEDKDEDDEDESIFADLDRDQITLEVTASVMLTRNLSWQISGQGLISELNYDNHTRWLPDTRKYDDTGIDPEDYADENGTFSALNSMMLVRWEYMPGSTLYFVWTRARNEWDDTTKKLHLKDEFDRFFSRGAENVWLLKMSYWWNI
jgi:hypothetical protein